MDANDIARKVLVPQQFMQEICSDNFCAISVGKSDVTRVIMLNWILDISIEVNYSKPPMIEGRRKRDFHTRRIVSPGENPVLIHRISTTFRCCSSS